MRTETEFENKTQLLTLVQEACGKIAPVWPLENFVAVNPYLGLSDQPFETAVTELAALANIKPTLDSTFYLEKIKTGRIKKEDIEPSLIKRSMFAPVDEFIETISKKSFATGNLKAIELVTDVASEISGKAWNRFSINRISTWASSYFDLGQASWKASFTTDGVYTSWKAEASIDRVPEITGLKNFRKHVRNLPDDAFQAIAHGVKTLGIHEKDLSLYFHSLFLNMGGWSSHCARLDWEGRLYGNPSGVLREFLAILISWEVCLFESLKTEKLVQRWNCAQTNFRIDGKIEKSLLHNLILQEAFDRALQRELIDKFRLGHQKVKKVTTRPKAQAIFCIDVRSEVFRRNLEMCDPEIETLGFAGFFGFPISYRSIGEDTVSAQCPVLLKPGPLVEEVTGDEKQTQRVRANRLMQSTLKKFWVSFKSGAVTCFSFVSPLGLSFLPKLFTDSFGITRTVPHPNQVGLTNADVKFKSVNLTPSENSETRVGIPLQDQYQLAKNALKSMSLKAGFAPAVLIVGHGSTSVNNPHATGLDCGACGGHTGEANARVAAEVLNNPNVRALLRTEGIDIPDDTLFVPCLHDTTQDEVTLLNEAYLPEDFSEKIKDIKRSLLIAGQTSRAERAIRMNVDPRRNVDRQIQFRSKDWSQVRPEWGLAGCSTFIVAQRERTRNLNFGGKSFLHNYDWKMDSGFSTLELIMTAPMVVTSWINLQYFGSSVDNDRLGAGNKTLHNITAGLGVLEGYSGDLRTGLPWQSLHDGEIFQHEPARLSVVIEAPEEAISMILSKHKSVRDLVDNEWIFLFTLGSDGQIKSKYQGNQKWEVIH